MTPDPSRSDQEEEPDLDPDSVLPPWSIWYAVRLMWAGAALSLVSLALIMLTADSIKSNLGDNLREQDKYSSANLDAAYQSFLASTFTVSLVGAGVWLWLAHANGAGKKWARLIATGLGATTILGFVVSFSATGATALQIVLAALNGILAAGVVALLWHSDSSDYYWIKSKPR